MKCIRCGRGELDYLGKEEHMRGCPAGLWAARGERNHNIIEVTVVCIIMGIGVVIVFGALLLAS